VVSEQLSQIDFIFLKKLAEDLTGSTFGDDKKYLFDTRLIGMAKDFGYSSLVDLVKHLRETEHKLIKAEREYFVDIMTTHETLFFRDTAPFKILKDTVLPELVKGGNKNLYLYSAACSRGQESVSMVLAILESITYLASPNDIKFDVIATDISQPAINYAKKGRYTKLEVSRGLQQKQLDTYFKKDDTAWILKDQYLNHIHYQVENLLAPTPRMAKFDIIFCRNVTIYMDKETVRKIYENFHRNLRDGGYLFVGHSERLTNHKDLFEYINTGIGSVYRKVS